MAPTGTSFRLVTPQREQIHSAVVIGMVVIAPIGSLGGEDAQRAADERFGIG